MIFILTQARFDRAQRKLALRLVGARGPVRGDSGSRVETTGRCAC
jgi:hypothetical protein